MSLMADGLLFAGARGTPVQLNPAMRSICAKLKVERATPHDLRRTHGTMICALGFGRDMMNKIQNHRDGGIGSVYDRHSYAKEIQTAMEAVANRIMMRVEGAPDNVVTLPKTKTA